MTKRFCASMCAIFIALFCSVLARAQSEIPTVVFDGTSKTFSFENVQTTASSTGQTLPDLFSQLKSVVPGDSLTQEIQLTVENVVQGDEVRIYLTAQAENDDYTTLDESAELTVESAQEDITEQITQPVLIGTFEEDDTEEVTLTLAIPLTVGNEISDLSAEIDWVFSAQIFDEDTPSVSPTPTPEKEAEVPKTGDTFNLWMWVIIASIGAVGIFCLQKYCK